MTLGYPCITRKKYNSLSFLGISPFEKLFIVYLCISYSFEMENNILSVSKNSNSLHSFSPFSLPAQLELPIEKTLSSLDSKSIGIMKVSWGWGRVGEKDLINKSPNFKQSGQVYSVLFSPD